MIMSSASTSWTTGYGCVIIRHDCSKSLVVWQCTVLCVSLYIVQPVSPAVKCVLHSDCITLHVSAFTYLCVCRTQFSLRNCTCTYVLCSAFGTHDVILLTSSHCSNITCSLCVMSAKGSQHGLSRLFLGWIRRRRQQTVQPLWRWDPVYV